MHVLIGVTFIALYFEMSVQVRTEHDSSGRFLDVKRFRSDEYVVKIKYG